MYIAISNDFKLLFISKTGYTGQFCEQCAAGYERKGEYCELSIKTLSE